MKISTVEDFSKRKNSDCLILCFFEDKTPVFASEGKKELEKFYKMPIRQKDFSSKFKEISLVYTDSEKEKRILLLGLGKEEELTEERIRIAFSKAIKSCKKSCIENISILFPEKCKIKNILNLILESLFLSNYLFSRLKKENREEDQKKLIQSAEIIGIDNVNPIIKREEKISTAVNLARDLINNNADEITPQNLAEAAKELEKISNKIKVKVFDKKKIEEENMGLLLAVNKGSFLDPVFISLEYLPKKENSEITCLIGKGITYDTGGLSLKPSTSMDTMKSDMAGASVVIATIYAAALLGIDQNIIGLVPATENAISSKSYKPGDVYTGLLDKSVEVENTDAEGRLILADAIAFANKKIKPERIIDLATLTGAIAIALGEEIAGAFVNNNELWEKLKKASEKTSERLWRLPLHQEYKNKLKSDIADIKNVGGRNASSITAALFLEAFVGKTPWAHIDIGGVAYNKKQIGYMPKNATGYGVRLLVEFLESLK